MFDVSHIAKLARIGLTAEEEKKYQKDLSAILDFIGKLEEVKVGGIEPMTQATGLNNVWREDAKKEKNAGCRRKILDNAPEAEKEQIKVKAVFE
jgi:aspartyl-tRNA(Asn)/glutamyl-tRNA(Gln) amidotransferase subunit C